MTSRGENSGRARLYIVIFTTTFCRPGD